MIARDKITDQMTGMTLHGIEVSANVALKAKMVSKSVATLYVF